MDKLGNIAMVSSRYVHTFYTGVKTLIFVKQFKMSFRLQINKFTFNCI